VFTIQLLSDIYHTRYVVHEPLIEVRKLALYIVIENIKLAKQREFILLEYINKF